MNALTSPAITELTTEDGPLNILGEFLGSWFNGSLHAVGANAPVLFPQVNLAFNQSPAIQPVYNFATGVDTTIRIVLLARNEIAESLDTVLFSGKQATARVLINFYVQAKHPTLAQGQQSAQTVANLLKAIFTNPDSRYALVAPGITAFAPEPIRAIASGDYAQRMVSVSAQLQYPILFGVQPLPVDGAVVVVATRCWPQSIEFFQPAPLIAGEYLMGTFTAGCKMALSGVRVTAFAPQTSPVTVQLEVNGQLVGGAVVIPEGIENQEVTTTADLTGITVTTGQVCKWKVIAAPDAEDSAWRCSVEMTATPQP